MKKSFSVSIFILCVFYFFSDAIKADWNVQTIDHGNIIDNIQSKNLIFDRNGRQHILYQGGNNLYYAHYDGENLVKEKLDNVSTNPSISIDSQSRVHIIFEIANSLEYITNSSGIWVRTRLFDDGKWKDSPSIAIDSKDKLHIIFRNSPNCQTSGQISVCGAVKYALRYATNKNGPWEAINIDNPDIFDDVGEFNSIAIDSKDIIHVSYSLSGNYKSILKYATNWNGAWVAKVIDDKTKVGNYNIIALDSQGAAHIGYFDSENKRLKYATNSNGTWKTSPIGLKGVDINSISLSVDLMDNAHISFVDNTTNHLWYLTNISGSWVKQHIVGNYKSAALAVDLLDRIQIATITKSASTKLKLLINRNGSWASQQLDMSKNVGKYSSLAVDQLGKSHISYIDIITGNLKYATNSTLTGKWRIKNIDRIGGSSSFTSIALDSSGYVHISYYDNKNKYLKYATNKGGAWEIYTVDGEGDVGSYSSIVVDSNDFPSIIYADSTNNILKYAKNINGVWAIQSIPGTKSSKNSIVIDSLNRIHIAYSSGGTLWYVNNVSGQWAIEEALSYNLGNYIKEPALALDASGKAYIAFASYTLNCGNGHVFYCVNSNMSLRYVTNSTGIWKPYVLSNDRVVGDISISINSEGKIFISYYYYTFYMYYPVNAGGDFYVASGVEPGNSVNWNNTYIDSFSGFNHFPSMKTQGNNIYISYYDNINGQLKYAVFE